MVAFYAIGVKKCGQNVGCVVVTHKDTFSSHCKRLELLSKARPRAPIMTVNGVNRFHFYRFFSSSRLLGCAHLALISFSLKTCNHVLRQTRNVIYPVSTARPNLTEHKLKTDKSNRISEISVKWVGPRMLP